MMTSELEIRAARAGFNRALAEADLGAIGPLLAPDVVLVTGTDSAVISGRKAQLQAWKREFADAARTVYTRTPEAVVVATDHPIAFEQGRWAGIPAAGGEPLATGTYAAKWRWMAGRWVIEAELFVTIV
ncbi:nuclear transport factor 2 family protein [Sphingomonas sp. AP4-R1]|uniref:nuclear transport factor 2 family protein n=1 Tax=Sphingomonas sp. AP4-R1 TaxID=2735134 RepID=UPI00149392AC|nr:nuclear transport factor 2 family protein [Sphingomonas sp. AP4-R1]QJU56514.1 nuclear transport factor 2 family protein [Sphingomonas sp. AP4-R1]